MKAQQAAERALKTAIHFRKEMEGIVSVGAESFAEAIARSAQYWADDDAVAVICRAADSGAEAIARYGSAERVIPAGDGAIASFFENRDFAWSDRNDGKLVSADYRSWIALPIAGKKETHLVAIVARKGRKFSREEINAGKALSSYFSAAFKDIRARNRKAASLAEEAEHGLLLRAQGSLGRKRQPFPGFFQLSDYSARTGSDFGEMWHVPDDGIIACACDVTAADAERHLGLVYLDTWLSILAQTSLGMRDIIERLNTDMAKRASECYVSISGIRYSRKSGRAEIAGAGSATAIHFSHDTMTTQTISFGAAAGVRKDIEIRSYALMPKTGDIVCLCTDGLCAARRIDGGLVGSETVAETLRKHYFLAAEDLAAKVLEAVSAASVAGANADDRTVQILKIL